MSRASTRDAHCVKTLFFETAARIFDVLVLEMQSDYDFAQVLHAHCDLLYYGCYSARGFPGYFALAEPQKTAAAYWSSTQSYVVG